MFPNDVLSFSLRGNVPLLSIHSDPVDNWSLRHSAKRCDALGRIMASSVLKDLKPIKGLHPFHATVEEDLRCAALRLVLCCAVLPSNNIDAPFRCRTLLQRTPDKYLSLGSVHDLTRCGMAHGIELPPPLTKEHIATVEAMRSIERRALFSDIRILRLEIGPLLREIVEFISRREGEGQLPPTVKMQLVGGHDTQLIPLMTALSLFPGTHWPDYGTTFAVEVWRDPQKPREVGIVQVVINGEVVLKTSLSAFVIMIAHLIPADYEADCQAFARKFGVANVP
jgi:hypothetical protein